MLKDYEKEFYRYAASSLAVNDIAFLDIVKTNPFVFYGLGAISVLLYLVSLFYLYKWWTT
jgi:hypothetical protein